MILNREARLVLALVSVLPAVFVVAFTLGFAAGGTTGSITYHNIAWTNLDKNELDKGVIEQVIPQFDVLVRFVGQKELAGMCQDDFALGCSVMNVVKPCTIYLPAGRTITAFPDSEDAQLKPEEGDHDDLFFHEVLHCIHPNWHAPWSAKNND